VPTLRKPRAQSDSTSAIGALGVVARLHVQPHEDLALAVAQPPGARSQHALDVLAAEVLVDVQPELGRLDGDVAVDAVLGDGSRLRIAISVAASASARLETDSPR
jgi:hypothetical protein